MLSGMIFCPVSPSYSTIELEHAVKIINPHCIFAGNSTIEKLKKMALEKICNVISNIYEIDDSGSVGSFCGFLKEKTSIKPTLETCNGREQVAAILLSSGTTGLQKAVQITHTNFIAQNYAVRHPYYDDGQHGQETVIATVPLFHVFGIVAFLSNALFKGYTIVLMPRFQLEKYIDTVYKYKATILHVPPKIVGLLATNLHINPNHLKSVKELRVGSSALTVTLVEKIKSKYPFIKCIKQGYGLTECTAVCHMQTPVYGKHCVIGSVGCLVPNVRAKVVDIDTRKSLEANKPGEILIQGLVVTKGYFNNDEATRNTMEGNWLKTGDIGYYDNKGNFYVIDRLKELIKCNGFQVSPTELENLLISLNGIADVAVVGIPDDLSGELPHAFIVKNSKLTLTKREIINYINDKVSSYKRLRGVTFLDAIPRNSVGKILRRELKKIDTNEKFYAKL
ncbi:DgyrCDS10717 [Dimorphilus gyrociliatus]|uniref:DgyrCDS10717 n=1 Tax=Dimorphilus gyrociliatus TaxID=2664684 RepID=A0A7I8W163_9ANNE|nr:DgyrCDS10717 [Dimorphilus gyrociliatus]